MDIDMKGFEVVIVTVAAMVIYTVFVIWLTELFFG